MRWCRRARNSWKKLTVTQNHELIYRILFGVDNTTMLVVENDEELEST
jgi:hypothetical protein